jgi:prolyl-tRNA editing enzyme YbaK/EbsC (Cys-tRNA(Pro) deacylase)
MVVCPGDKRIPPSTLKRIIGSKVSMTDAEETERATGFKPGGVCPFGLAGVELFLDAELGSHPTVYPAAGTDATGVAISLALLRDITGGRIVDFGEEA